MTPEDLRAAVAAGILSEAQAASLSALANDRAETAAIREVFASPPPVSATKSLHGHAIGATGALEAIACLLALTEGVLPPTMGFRVPDPDCDLDVVADAARPATLSAVSSRSRAASRPASRVSSAASRDS